jgi:hypothetical protein
MAARVTAAEVGAIIEVDDAISLTPFINTANLLVTRICSDSDYTAATLKEIELWLSAHFYTIRDPRAEGEGAGPVNARYQGKTAMAFDASTYGQQAMLIDTAGNLLALQKRKGGGSASVVWAGTDLEELEYGSSS